VKKVESVIKAYLSQAIKLACVQQGKFRNFAFLSIPHTQNNAGGGNETRTNLALQILSDIKGPFLPPPLHNHLCSL
jgi:hypothetical protein